MRTSMLMEMNQLSENGGRQGVNAGGAGGGRRRSKGSGLTHKKNKPPQRGMGVEQLERVIRFQETQEQQQKQQRLRLQERWKKMTEVPSLGHPPLPSINSVPNVAVQFRPHHAPSPTPPMMFHGIGMHGANLFSSDHVVDPSVIGSGNVGLHFDQNSKDQLSSIPSYVKCVSDGCGVCHKKKRISNGCWVNQFRNFSGNNTVVEMIEAGKTRRSSGQVAELMTVHRNGGGALPEYEFLPGKGDGGAEEEYKGLMKMGTTTETTTWCGSGTSVGGGVIGLRGGEGSCVTAITGGEEGSVSSVDLTLKLSY